MKVTSNIEKKRKKWDEQAIDHAYESLLDIIGDTLDRLTLTGCHRLFADSAPLRAYVELMERMEKELLVQWKIKEEKGVSDLFTRQKRWLEREKRDSSGFFALWNEFCFEMWKTMSPPRSLIGHDPWVSLLILLLSDSERLRGFKMNLESSEKRELLERVCNLFQTLCSHSPYHQILSFLNLIELGAGVRPEILPLEKVLETSKLSGFPSVIQREFADIIEKNHWRHVPRKLIHFWKSNSGGLFSLYSACIVRANSSGECSFRGVVPKNWPRFEDLIGLESNKRKLIKNMESFIHRGQAAHVLLWGGRGTGKSSSVLALLGEYIDQGLRLIEIRSDELFLIPELTRILDSRPEKFLLFCDDLSFGKDNPDYRYLKSIMEGSVFTPASNLLFIATTNRKDLVLRGKLDERQPEQKQLIDEKRAIDDRFGLKLFYEVPTFKQLLNILYFYADKTGLSYDRKELGEEFHRFARLNNHDQPSGRTARQFIREWKRERSMSESR